MLPGDLFTRTVEVWGVVWWFLFTSAVEFTNGVVCCLEVGSPML